MDILKGHQGKLHQLAEYLYDHETITGEEFMDILGRGAEEPLDKGGPEGA